MALNGSEPGGSGPGGNGLSLDVPPEELQAEDPTLSQEDPAALDEKLDGKLDGKLNLTEVRELLKLPSAARAKVLKVMSTAQLHAAMSSSNSAPLRNYIRKLLDERRGPGP